MASKHSRKIFWIRLSQFIEREKNVFCIFKFIYINLESRAMFKWDLESSDLICCCCWSHAWNLNSFRKNFFILLSHSPLWSSSRIPLTFCHISQTDCNDIQVASLERRHSEREKSLHLLIDALSKGSSSLSTTDDSASPTCSSPVNKNL